MRGRSKKLLKIFGWVLLAVLIYQLGFVSGKGTGKKEAIYDGASAEEWADEADYWLVKYEQLRDCVEDYDSPGEGGDILFYCE